MSGRTREFRIELNEDDLTRCEQAGVSPPAFVSASVREALASLPDTSAEEEVGEAATEELAAEATTDEEEPEDAE